jgi:hypothetical protein
MVNEIINHDHEQSKRITIWMQCQYKVINGFKCVVGLKAFAGRCFSRLFVFSGVIYKRMLNHFRSALY